MRTSRQPAKRQGTKQKATKTLSATFSSVSSCIPPYKTRSLHPRRWSLLPFHSVYSQATNAPQTDSLFLSHSGTLSRNFFAQSSSAPPLLSVSPGFLTDKGPGFRTFTITDKSPIPPGWASSQKQSSIKYLLIFIRKLSDISFHIMLNNVLILSNAGINKENCYK